MLPRLRSTALVRLGRRLSTAAPSTPLLQRPSTLLVAGGVGGVLMQTYFGTADDFFEQKYITNKDPDDIMEFYQAEDLLKIFTFGLPFIFDFIMGGVQFAEEAGEGWDAKTLNTALGMEVSFSLIEEEEDTDEGSVVGYFNRHERFKNFIPLIGGILLWDQTWNFGYKRLADGSCEVFHRGERFYGPFPVRIGVWLHQSLVLYLCEKHVNSPAFGSGDSELVEAQLAHIPQHVFKQFLRSLQRDVRAAKLKSSPTASEEQAKMEATLVKLKALETKSSDVYVAKQTNLKRRQSTASADALDEVERSTASIKVTNKDAESTIQDAIAQINTTNEGSKAVGDALQQLVSSPELDYKVDQKLARKLSIGKVRRFPSRMPSSAGSK